MERPQAVAIRLQLPKLTGVEKLCESSFPWMLQFPLFVYSRLQQNLGIQGYFPTIMTLVPADSKFVAFSFNASSSNIFNYWRLNFSKIKTRFLLYKFHTL